MPMPSKGPRKPLTVRIPADLYETLEQRRTDAGVSSVSQFVSDLLAGYAGREDLVMELGQEEVLDLLMTA
ncbi:ribbon-helix-helix protein, CopG family [Rhodococcus hoagii]|nr:ribbon-helix-helix protein, CopG family [Prescottella equi]